MVINIPSANPALVTTDQSHTGSDTAACSEATKAGEKCRSEAVGVAPHKPAGPHHSDCKDLPSCKITDSTETVAPLSGRISKDLSITDLATQSVLQESSEKLDSKKARDISSDHVTNVTVSAAATNKASDKADFYVSASGAVTVLHNPDLNKNTALTIEYGANPAAKKSEGDRTAQEKAELEAQKVALNTLTSYLEDRYSDNKTWSVADSSGMVDQYLLKPAEPDSQTADTTTGSALGMPPGIPGGVPGTIGGFNWLAGRYPEHNSSSTQTNPYANLGAGGYNPRYGYGEGYGRPSMPYMPQMGAGMFPGMYPRNNEISWPTGIGTESAEDPFELTAFSILGWLKDMGYDLGNPPDPEKLAKVIKKLEKEDPKLAKELKSDGFTKFVQDWHTSGKAPSHAELAKALPENLRTQISHDLSRKYTAQFKTADGKTDWGKVAVSIHDGRTATAQDMKEHADIAAEATAIKTEHFAGNVIPSNDRIPVITASLQLAGLNVTSQNIAAAYHLVTRESGWRTNIVNTWDSNAAKGTPSIGLAQTIGPTFRENCVNGHTNILNPVDNLTAGIRYAEKRYGRLDCPGQGLLIAAMRNNY
jgi:hypothetical protein